MTGDFWRHTARGFVYENLGGAEVQTSHPIMEGEVLTIYRGNDGKMWARPVNEFFDGRFVKLEKK